MIHDPHISPLLDSCSADELEPLAQFLSSRTTSTLRKEHDVLKYWPDHTKYVPSLVKEIQLFGGHTIKDRIGSQSAGQPYFQIVRRLLKELGERSFAWDIVRMERRLVQLTLDIEFDDLEPSKQDKLMDAFYRGELFEGGLQNHTVLDKLLNRHDPSQPSIDKQKVKKVATQEAKGFIKGKLAGLAIKAVARGLAGPIGLGLTAWSLLGPADRVNIPVIWYIAYLRHLKG